MNMLGFVTVAMVNSGRTRGHWDSLTGTITARKNVIFSIDADAHVGSEVSGHVGCGGCAEDQNFNGAAFHDVLRAQRLCLPATFEAFVPDVHVDLSQNWHMITLQYRWIGQLIRELPMWITTQSRWCLNLLHLLVGKGLIRSFPRFIWTVQN